MQDLNEGILDFLKKIWNSIIGNKPTEEQEREILNSPSYIPTEEIKANDPQLKKKLAKVFVRGLRLHQEAMKYKIVDDELLSILKSVWNNKMTIDDFLKLKQNGTIDKVYARTREKIRYRRKKTGTWNENKI